MKREKSILGRAAVFTRAKRRPRRRRVMNNLEYAQLGAMIGAFAQQNRLF